MGKCFVGLFALLLLFGGPLIYAQSDTLRVDDFHFAPLYSIKARTSSVIDGNKKNCGLVVLRIAIPDARIEGSYVVKVEKYDNEYYIWMAEDASYIIIKTSEYLPLEYEFPEPIQSKSAYVMTVRTPRVEKKKQSGSPLLPFYVKVGEEWNLGYLDAKGRIAIPATLKGVGSLFENGTATVSYQNSWYYINENGQRVVSPNEEYCGLHIVKENGKYGYADRSGRIVIPIKYDRAYNFQNRRAIVLIDEEYGVITPKGEWIFKGGVKSDYRNNYAVVKLSDDNYRFIDTNGSVNYRLGIYKYAGPFSDGLALVKNSKGQYGYIDCNGKSVIPYRKLDGATSFSEGLAEVTKIGLAIRKYYIDKRGNEIFKTSYFCWGGFHEGLLQAKSDGDKWGYLDTHGNVAIKFQFERVSNFHKGFAEVKLISPSQWVWITKTGKILTDEYGRPYISFPVED